MFSWIFPPLCVVLLAVGAHCGSYLLTAPSALQPSSMYDISVDILNTTGVDVAVALQSWTYNGTIRDYDVNILDSMSGTFHKDNPGSLSFVVNPSMRCDGCRLHVRGTGGLQFEHTIPLPVSRTVVVIFVQTDKAIYKPGQTVRFRAFAVYKNLAMYSGNFNIDIKDPSGNKIKVDRGLTAGEYGVVEGRLELSEQPQFGVWSIHVAAEEGIDIYTQKFTVANYELPRFEINVKLPPFGLISESSLSGKVKATYTFGEDVKGRVELHIGRDELPDICGEGPKTTQISFDIDGSSDFQIPKEDIQRAVSFYDGVRVKVTAFVTEAATGVRLNGSSVITYYNKDSKIKFLDNTPAVFKPGLSYTAFIQATTPDEKSPPTGSDMVLSVYTSVHYELTVPDQKFYDNWSFEGTYPLPGQNITLPADGVAPVSIEIPNNATTVTIKATFRGVSVTKTVDKTWSQSNNFLRLTLLDKNVKAGSDVSFRVEGTEPLTVVNYEVIARGGKVYANRREIAGEKTFIFSLHVTSDMAPVAHVVAYYNRGGDEIVADSLAFDVEGLFHNQVTVNLNRNESQPREQVQVLMTADPMSKVNVLAVDQSVLLLKTGNDITPEKVDKEVSKFDRGVEKPASPEFALSYSSTDVKDVFESSGLLVISDVRMEKPYNVQRPPGEDSITVFQQDFDSVQRKGSSVESRGEPTQAIARIRKIFPETWLWNTVDSGSDGTAILSTTVPDTITSWVISAFATHPSSGLGVAPTTTKLKVFRPFFVSLSYPSTVTRGEHIVVQATVFNYLQSDVAVLVKLKENSKFLHILIDSSGTETLQSGDREENINVPSDEQGVVYFPILATEIGTLDIVITAQSTLAADGVERSITVKAEGAPLSYSTPLFINLDSNTTLMDSLAFTLPPSAVAGSEIAKVKVTGDLIGSSLDGLASLLALPTGCGEQSMVKFAPDLYIARYLRDSGQLTDAVEAQIVHYLATGYQRQLTYQRYDGSFSAFGNRDPTGSTWLTAMVAGTLAEARDFIYVDPGVISRAMSWLLERQHRDGSFASMGKVLDPNTQFARTGEGLTAYVLIALHEAQDVASQSNVVWYNATRKSIQYLEDRISSNAVTNPLSLAIVSYALRLANSPLAQQALDQLNSLSKTEGGLTYWEDTSIGGSSTPNPSASTYIGWMPPIVQARPVNILTTSYAVLAMTAAGKVQEAFPSVQWLIAQRNPYGGFASSQDTSVGLQALSAYAAISSGPETNLAINVVGTAGSGSASFQVNEDNAWTLQVQQFNQFPQQTNVQATGEGFSLVEMVYYFNIDNELSTPSFDVSTVLLDDDLDSFNLMVCTKWLWDRDTGMVVQEVGIPSGFEPDLSSLGDVAGLERSERRGDTVAVYFDKISKSSLCYSLVMTRTAKVARSQVNFVRTFDYYQPSDQSTVFYHPRKLRESTICDVCDGCC